MEALYAGALIVGTLFFLILLTFFLDADLQDIQDLIGIIAHISLPDDSQPAGSLRGQIGGQAIAFARNRVP